MAEWLKAAVLKTVRGVTPSWVRILLPPPSPSAKPILQSKVVDHELADIFGSLCEIIPRVAISSTASTGFARWYW